MMQPKILEYLKGNEAFKRRLFNAKEARINNSLEAAATEQ